MSTEVAGRLASIAEFAGRIHDAARLAQLTAEALVQVAPAAFVLPLSLRGGAADAVTGLFRQGIERAIGVLIIVRVAGDVTGGKAFRTLEPLVEQVIERIAGWAPDDVIGVYRLVRGELIGASAGTLSYQLDFAVEDQLRIAA